MFFLTTIAHIAFTSFSWVENERLNRQNISSISQRHNYCYFSTCLTLKEILPFWVGLTDVSFILSQQVIVGGIVYVLCLLTVLQSVTRNLQGELTNWLKGTNVEPRSKDDDLSRRSWGLDFVMALGSGADSLISKSASSGSGPCEDAWTALSVPDYTTVLYLHACCSSEERNKLIILLPHLLWGIKRRTITLAEVAAEHENARILPVLPTFCHAKK
ncbi:hypothetical protein BV898_19977, partial [Hypsibius exemplaris]